MPYIERIIRLAAWPVPSLGLRLLLLGPIGRRSEGTSSQERKFLACLLGRGLGILNAGAQMHFELRQSRLMRGPARPAKLLVIGGVLKNESFSEKSLPQAEKRCYTGGLPCEKRLL